MKFLIISHVLHKTKNAEFLGYGPYVKEMNLWLKFVDSVEIVAPLLKTQPNKIDLPYNHKNLIFTKVPSFNLIGLKNKFFTLLKLPYIFAKILFAMKRADHIHLRCPGNMGLLGAIAQIFFPNKIKTVKYAGNWDPQSKQPFSYVLQKKIISSPRLSKNTKVLIYGKWENQTKNIIPFFTASYMKKEIIAVKERDFSGVISLLFIGSLSLGKQPLIVLKVAKFLIDKGFNVELNFCGEGMERITLETYIKENNLNKYVQLHGNQNSDFVKNLYKKSHFLILMSKSEGWPKVLAEAMFWGCIPISTNVSCVSYMLGNGLRGRVVSTRIEEISENIEEIYNNQELYLKMSKNALVWSRNFTLEHFQEKIGTIING